MLRRSLREQRRLLALHLAALDDKATELEAFAARVSHDLKGPLGTLRAYSDVLSIHDAGDVRDVGARMRRGVDRLVGIVDDLLALSVEGRPRPGLVDVAPIVREVLDELARDLAGADVAIAVGDVATACSAGVLAQVLRNLVSNAIKFRSPERDLALRIEARPSARDHVEIVVADNGAGMDEAAVARAFEPHFRASDSAPGHGLGLSIVERAVQSIGGSVTLRSAPGEGTWVVVSLPAA